MQDLSFDRRAALDGIRTIAPIVAPGLPFGLVLGFLVEDKGIDPIAGWASSWIIFGGASQLVALNLLGDGTSALVIVVSVLLINSRHAMYSAALRPVFAEYPTWFRVSAPYLLIDQVFAITHGSAKLNTSTPQYRMWHFVGAGLFAWTIWQISVGLGILLGDVVREEWSLSFAVAIVFVGLLVLSVKDRPGIVAAVVAGVVVVITRELPQGSGLLLAIVLGVIAAGVAESRLAEGATR
jgi:predicted branched-subunit amino acid permease